MRHISILEPATKEAVEAFGKKTELSEHINKDHVHPQEDYLLTSETLPVFVISDGVTLNFRKFIEDGVEYPNPSPAGDVSRIFCEAAVQGAEAKYDSFNESDVETVFKEGNAAVKKYNDRIGKTDVSGNVTGLYAATGSFVVVKGGKGYWMRICDAFVAHFSKDMELKFMSSGSCTPYAVINGEKRMAEHIESGVFDLEPRDRVFVFSDGFEHYAKHQKFLELFKEWNDSLKDHITAFSQEMNREDPTKYGHERSLIAVEI